MWQAINHLSLFTNYFIDNKWKFVQRGINDAERYSKNDVYVDILPPYTDDDGRIICYIEFSWKTSLDKFSEAMLGDIPTEPKQAQK
jgi:hypothetical protein